MAEIDPRLAEARDQTSVRRFEIEHMFGMLVAEPAQLAGLSAAEMIDAARACARAENAACARKVWR